jgi:hypothetical protein
MSKWNQQKRAYVPALGFNVLEEELAPQATIRNCTFGLHAGTLPAGHPGSDVDCQCSACRLGREHFGEFVHGSVPMGECGNRPAAWFIAGMFDLMMTLAINYESSDVLDGVRRFRRHASCNFADYAGDPANGDGRRLMARFLAEFLESFVTESQEERQDTN